MAYSIEQSKKPHTTDETLINPAAVAMSQGMHGEKIVSELMTVPLSNDTIARSIHDMAKHIKSQLKGNMERNMHYRSTNLSMSLILLSCWHSSDTHDGKLHKDMLFCSVLEGICTGSGIFTKQDTKIRDGTFM